MEDFLLPKNKAGIHQLPVPPPLSTPCAVSGSISGGKEMFEQQHFLDRNSDFGDSKSWLAGVDNTSPTHARTHSHSNSAANGSLDRDLYNDLVEMIPLVQSLIESKGRSSFTRRGSMIYTKTPSKESLSRKLTDRKGRSAAPSIPTRKKKAHAEDQGKYLGDLQNDDSLSIISSRSLASEKEKEELAIMKEQLEDLQKKLLEKEELLKSAEMSKNSMDDIYTKLEAFKRQAAEKDSIVKSVQLQLSDAKIKLADKQAALEKTQWQAMTANQKVEKLQEELESMQGAFSSFMLLLEGLSKNNSIRHSEDYDTPFHEFDHLSCIDDVDDVEMRTMEEARQAYDAAVAASKEKGDEASLAAATNARLYLQSLVFRSGNKNRKDIGLS